MQKLLNFDVSIQPRDGGRYTCVAASPNGEAHADFALPFTDKDLQILVLQVLTSVGRVRRKARRIQSQERQLLEDFGGQLFQAVFSGTVRSFLDRSLAAAENKNAGLRIRLRLPPELANIPWEYLYDRESAGFVSLSPETVLVRYVEMPRPPRPFPISPPLRILTMISAPTDVSELQGDDEWAKLNAALTDLTDRGMVQADRLEAGTLAALQRPLRQREYHVLHFVGHGMYDEDAQDGALALEAEDGRTRLVTGRDLGVMLRGHRSLRLVVLNACEGARSARDDPFGGVAQALVRQGIPAVIAMQFEVSDPAALVFSQSFYQAIADGLPVDLAMVEARKTMFAEGNEVEWATPVLYLRSPDGQIFVKGRTAEAEREAQEKAEREAQEKAEREAQEKAEREAQEKAEREAQEKAEREAQEKAEVFDPAQQGMPATTHDEQGNYENPEGSGAEIPGLRLTPEERERRVAKFRATREAAHRHQVEEYRKAAEEEPATALGATPGAVTSSSTPGTAPTGTLASDEALTALREKLSGGSNQTEQGQVTDRAAPTGTAAVPRAPDAHGGARSAGNAIGEAAQKNSGPARNDLDRAARLLTDAERMANSITDESSKALALSRIAQALAATDPDRAARLSTDAERIANSITDKPSKALALSRIAQALAATDPDRAARLSTDAERIANSITTGQSWREQALSRIAQALAATDPDRAERIANSITDESWKAQALSRIAQALAATDPDRAERIANSITDKSWKAQALSRIAQALAATDPDRAARLSTDAERIANSITDEFPKASALSDIAQALAATDPDRAARLLTDAERIAKSITDKSWKA